MKKIGIIMGFALSLFSIVSAQTINSEKSVVNFKIDGMFGAEVEGTFTGMQGEISFDENSLESSSFNVTVDAASVFTDSNKRDKHLKNEDFFEVEAYANIRFKSESIAKTADGYRTDGTITMHGISQPASIDFTYNNKVFTGQIEVNRFDYKVGEDTKANKVAELAKVEIVCVVE